VATIHVDLLGTETRYYETVRFRTRCIESGAGDPLLLLHGGGGHAETYSRNMRRLGERHRAMAIDFIWHGLSSKPAFKTGNWLKDLTQQVLELMDFLSIDRASVEGESLGAWVAMDLAINHPDRMKKIILNTAWGMDVPGISEADFQSLRVASINALRNPTVDLIRKRMEWLMPLGGTTDEIVDVRLALWSRADTRDALIAYYDRLFSPECAQYMFGLNELAQIELPTLLMWTEKNPYAGPSVARAMADVIRGSQLHIMSGAAHWPQWEKPEEHDRVVLAFLDK